MKEVYVKNSRNFTENLCLQDAWTLQYTKGEILQKYLWHVPHLTQQAQTFGQLSQHSFPCTRGLGWAYCLSPVLQKWTFMRCRISQVTITESTVLSLQRHLLNLQQKWLITLPLLSKTFLFGSGRLIYKNISYKFELLSFTNPQPLTRKSYDLGAH